MADKATNTKELFMSVSDELFSAHGYDNINVDTICKRAGKAKGLFFYYFEKKENIVRILLEKQIIEMKNGMQKYLDSQASSIDKMNFLMNALFIRGGGGPRAFYYFKDTTLPEWVDSHGHALKDKYIFPMICSIIEEGIAQGIFKLASFAQIEIIYLGISQYMHRHYNKMADDEYYSRAIRAVTQVLEDALGCVAGIIIINEK